MLDFSGLCIKELVAWTIKQSDAVDLARDPANVKALVSRIKTYSLHCDTSKRLGAALIFNNIYTILREEEQLMNIFWLELLYAFVMNSTLINWNCFQDNNCLIQVNSALDHIKRVLIQKHELFNSPDNVRRTPPFFEGNCLKDAVKWLLGHVNSKSMHCRQKSIELVCDLAPLVTGADGSLRTFIDKHLPNRNEWVAQIIDANPFQKVASHQNVSCDDLFKQMENFLCAVDGCSFLIDKDLLVENCISEKNGFFNSLQYFFENIAEKELKNVLQFLSNKNTTVCSVTDKEIFNHMKSRTVLRILKFLIILLGKGKHHVAFSVSFWIELIIPLVCTVIFDPSVLGFEINSQNGHKGIVLSLLALMKQKLFASLEQINSCMLLHTTELEETTRSKGHTSFKYRQFLKGLLLLQESEFANNGCMLVCDTNLAKKVFQRLIKSNESEICVVSAPNDVTHNYCDLMLQLALQDNAEFLKLIEKMYDQTIVQVLDSENTVECGRYIFDMFHNTISKQILEKFDVFFDIAITKAPADTVFYLSRLLRYIQDNKKYIDTEIRTTVVEKVLSNFNQFLPYFDESYLNVEMGMEFIKRIAFITAHPGYSLNENCIQTWIISLLTRNWKDLPVEVIFNFRMEIFDLLVHVIGPDDEELIPLR